MRLLNRSLRTSIVSSTAIVLFVLIGIESFLEFVKQLSDMGVGHFTALKALVYVPLQLPTDLYQMFPMVGFLGSLIGLGRLASTSQLIVMRTSGVSVLQIVMSVLKTGVLMVLVITVIGEYVAPRGHFYAEHLKAVAMGQSSGELLQGVWLKQKNRFVYIDEVSSLTSLKNVACFKINAQGRLIRTVIAEKGELHQGKWLLYGAKETEFLSNRVISKHIAVTPLGVLFEPKLFQKAEEGIDQESAYGLFQSILYRRKMGLVTSQYQYEFWKRVVQPVTSLLMICLGVPFVFGSLRSLGMDFRIMIGVLIGFGFYMLNHFFGPITLVYQFPPLLAACLPTLLFLLIYLLLLIFITK